MAYALIIPQVKGIEKLAFQRRDGNAPTEPNLLGLFGGSIEGDESPLEGACREINEETSLNIQQDDLHFLVHTTMPTERGEAEVHLFSAIIPDEHFEVYEGDGYELYTKQEFLERTDTSPAAVHLLTTVTLSH